MTNEGVRYRCYICGEAFRLAWIAKEHAFEKHIEKLPKVSSEAKLS